LRLIGGEFEVGYFPEIDYSRVNDVNVMDEVMVMNPEQKMKFFLELMQQLGLNTYKRSTTEIPASHIAEI
jgi:hypothetical protein